MTSPAAHRGCLVGDVDELRALYRADCASYHPEAVFRIVLLGFAVALMSAAAVVWWIT